MNNGKVVGFGGRVKCAAVGMNHLMNPKGLDERLRGMRENPPFELLKAFFPGDHARMRQVMRGPGFYRPVLKTDQGMPGNFFRFRFDRGVETTDLSLRMVSGEEGIAIPEPWAAHDERFVQQVQQHFASMNLHETAQMLGDIEHTSREADKGRGAFFFIRPGELDRPIVFGNDIVVRVERAINAVVLQLKVAAQELAQQHSVPWYGENVVYGQFDVFITSNGEVCVERVNLPDVGFFMTELTCPPSRLLPGVQHIVHGIRKEVCERLATIGRELVLVTRDEVLDRREDLLEIREIESLQIGLAAYGVTATVIRASDVATLRKGAKAVLLNIDYDSDGGRSVLGVYASQQVACFPNPLMQMAARRLLVW